MTNVQRVRRLTLRKCTRRNALAVMRGSRFPLSGACTPAQPWGQCTAYLSDGTPVEKWEFPSAIMARAAGDKTAVPAMLAKWIETVEALI